MNSGIAIYGAKIGGATDDAWAKMSAFVDEYLENLPFYADDEAN